MWALRGALGVASAEESPTEGAAVGFSLPAVAQLAKAPHVRAQSSQPNVGSQPYGQHHLVAVAGFCGAAANLAASRQRKRTPRRQAAQSVLCRAEAQDDASADPIAKTLISWEYDVATEIKERAASCLDGQPFMVALVGIPGSGKSTSANVLAGLLGPTCFAAPMDGFHIPMADLRARPDAADAIYRRGAADTFDPAGLKVYVQRVRGGDEDAPELVQWPGFDHAVGDPVEGELTFDRRQHRIVLVEGLYLLHDQDGWDGVAELFDHTIFLAANVERCVAQVKERNKCIPGYTPEEIEVRTELVDRKNAEVVQRSARHADRQVNSTYAPP